MCFIFSNSGTRLAFLQGCPTLIQFPLNWGWKTACFVLHFLSLYCHLFFFFFFVYFIILYTELAVQNRQPVLVVLFWFLCFLNLLVVSWTPFS